MVQALVWQQMMRLVEFAIQGSNISVTGTEKARLERELHMRPGDPEWFQLWFSLPKFMNGERAVGTGYRGIKK